MNGRGQADLVEMQARVIIIKSYVQFILLESATMPQFHVVIEGYLNKLQLQVLELEALSRQLCDDASSRSGSFLTPVS